MLPLDGDLFLLLHGFVYIYSLGYLDSGDVDVGDHCVKVDILGVIVKLSRLLLVIEHELQVVTALASIFSKGEAVLPLALRNDGYDAELLRILVDGVVKLD